MGTVYNIKIISKLLDENFISKVYSSIDSSLKEVNQQMSTYIAESEISRFNSYKQTSKFEISKEFANVISNALKVYEISSGAFDITINPLVNLWGFGSRTKKLILPSDSEIEKALEKIGSKHINIIDNNYIIKKIPELEIDLGAIAKGYGVDVVSQTLNDYNFNDYMVEIGGEVYAKGKNLKKQTWKIGIDKPQYLAFPGQNLQEILSISDVGIATSGDYRNYFEYEGNIYSHTINPKTGKPVTHNLASVTIIASNCMQADALATAVLVMGTENGLKLIESIEDVEGYLISRIENDKFQSIMSSGFKKYLEE